MTNNPRMAFDIAAKFYHVEVCKQVIEAVQKAHGCDVLKACQICIEKITQAQADNGMTVAMLLATTVEMIEAK